MGANRGFSYISFIAPLPGSPVRDDKGDFMCIVLEGKLEVRGRQPACG
jgi:hypothetical protein